MGAGASAGLAAALKAADARALASSLAGLPAEDRRRLRAALEAGGRAPPALALIEGRRDAAGFDARPVPHEVLAEVLASSRSVPTSANTQPWTLIVCEGAKKDKLAGLLEAHACGDGGSARDKLLPDATVDPVEARGDPGAVTAAHHKVGLEDGEALREAERLALDLSGAPVHVLLCAPREQCEEEGVMGIYLDMGSLLQSLLLGCAAKGLGSRVHFSVARYAGCCREALGGEALGEDLLLVCGVSIGWPTGGGPAAPRPAVDAFTSWGSCDGAWLGAGGGAAGDGSAVGLLRLIQGRHCSHSLNPSRSVPSDVVRAILGAARWAPCAGGAPPWSVTVVQGAKRDELSRRMLEHFDAGNDGAQTYKKYSARNTAQMQRGKDAYGYELYEVKHGLARDDKAGRRQKYRPNYEFWGAPVLLLLRLPGSAVAGTYVDLGAFMYSILIAMHSYGLGGKPLGSTAKYSDLVREVLGEGALPAGEHLVCGLCIGWPTGGRDPREVPDFFPSRLRLEEVTRYCADAAWGP